MIDLSADFRIRDIPTWEKMVQNDPCRAATRFPSSVRLVRTLQRRHRQNHAGGQPGCYPTCVSLPLLPLLQAGRLKANAPLIADCKSGVSGAGRKASTHALLCEAGDNFKAYGVGGHRHLPEIQQTLSGLQDHVSDGLIFVPHLVPMIRGMHATLYLHLQEHTDPEALLREYYRDSPFVDILLSGSTPETRSVRGANLCRISVQKAPDQDDVDCSFRHRQLG